MIKNILLVLITMLLTTAFSGCAVKNIRHTSDFSSAVSSVSEELNRYIDKQEKETTIILTSMVDVNNFSQSSNFGRLYSDSLLTNLKRSGWNVVDYRGVNLLTKEKKGEFYLSRKDLKNLPKKHNFVVGTYGVYGDKILINVRILRPENNEVLVASNSMITDPEMLKMALVDNCKTLECQKTYGMSNFSISLKADDCVNTRRCECTNPDACLGEECSTSCKRN